MLPFTHARGCEWKCCYVSWTKKRVTTQPVLDGHLWAGHWVPAGMTPGTSGDDSLALFSIPVLFHDGLLIGNKHWLPASYLPVAFQSLL